MHYHIAALSTVRMDCGEVCGSRHRRHSASASWVAAHGKEAALSLISDRLTAHTVFLLEAHLRALQYDRAYAQSRGYVTLPIEIASRYNEHSFKIAVMYNEHFIPSCRKESTHAKGKSIKIKMQPNVTKSWPVRLASERLARISEAAAKLTGFPRHLSQGSAVQKVGGYCTVIETSCSTKGRRWLHRHRDMMVNWCSVYVDDNRFHFLDLALIQLKPTHKT